MKTSQNKQSVTLIEFIFVVLIIAIISSISISKISSSHTLTDIVSCKNDFNIINLSIKNKIKHNTLENIKSDFYLEDNNILFSNIINNFDSSSWKKISSDTYNYILNTNDNINFTYNNKTNIFTCNKTEYLCKKVLN